MKKLLIVLILASFVMASCGGQQNERDADFRTGSQGLVMRFLPNQPPTILYDDQQMDIQMEIANRGAYTVGETFDSVYFSGFDHNIIRGININGEQLQEIEGKTLYNTIGSVDFYQVAGDPLPLSQVGIDKYPFTLLATLCYKYETLASANVCVDPNPFGSQQREKVCTAVPVGLGTQGGPIAVSMVDVQPSSQKTRFKITIQNVGGGTVYKEGTDFKAKCSPYDTVGLQPADIDMVAIEDVTVSGQSIKGSCKGLDKRDLRHLRLINGVNSFTCEFSNPVGSTAYITPLVVRLSYGYRNSVSTTVEMRTSG